MRRLTIIPCAANWDAMRPTDDADAAAEVGPGRRCESCARHVNDVQALDGATFDALIERAAVTPTCARVVHEGGRALAKRGAELVLAVAFAGATTACAPALPPASMSTTPHLTPTDHPGALGEGAAIGGRVVDVDGQPVEGALLVLVSPALPETRQVSTQPDGSYRFAELPPGAYTVQLLHDSTDITRSVELPERAAVRFNFKLRPENGIILGIVSIDAGPIDTTTASSSMTIRMD